MVSYKTRQFHPPDTDYSEAIYWKATIISKPLLTSQLSTVGLRNLCSTYEQCPFFTSMFVERMEGLEYRQKFDVELNTFPDSTNTETPRKLVFSWTCVCLSVCVCEKFVS